MKTSFFFTITTFCIINSAASQAPAIEWQKCLGGGNNDYGSNIVQTTDGGYIVAGFGLSTEIVGSSTFTDSWIVKLNTSGEVKWSNNLGGSASDAAFGIQQTTDEGYVVAGYSNSNDGDVSGNHGGSYDYWIVKLNSNGELQWQKSLGGSADDIAYNIQLTTDGGFIVAGLNNSSDGDVSGNHGGSDYWVVKLSSTGEMQWQKSLGGSGDDVARSVEQTTDGGYIVAGYSNSSDGDVSGNHGGNDYWIAKLSATGEMQWQKCLGSPGEDVAYGIKQLPGGGYIVTGSSASNGGDVNGNHGSYDIWVVRLDDSGALQWQKSLGGAQPDNGRSIQLTSDGGYIVAGNSISTDGDVSGNHGNIDYWIVKLGSSGNIQWQKSLGGTNVDSDPRGIKQTSDGGYIAAGSSASNNGDVTGNHGGYDYWVVKLAPDPLPLSLLSFDALKQGSSNRLNWQATNEINTKAFHLERSNNGQRFAEIAMVAAAGNSTTNNNYHFTDVNPLPGKNFYRLKTEDKDGKTTYSMVRLIDRRYSISATINPNPVTGNILNLLTSNEKNASASLSITSTDGRKLNNTLLTIAAGSNNNKVNISSLPPGTYFITLLSGEEKQVLRFVKQ